MRAGYKNWLRPILLIIGWAASVAVICWGAGFLGAEWNFFDWSGPNESNTGALPLIFVVAGIVGLFFLAGAMTSRIVQIVSFLCVITALFFAIQSLPAETITAQTTNGFFGNFLSRSHESPAWFRLSEFAVLSIPFVFWFIGIFRRYWRISRR